MRHVTLLLLCSSTLLLAACGGHLDPLPLDDIFDSLATSNPLREGSIAHDGTIDPDAPLRVGDDEDDRSWRAFTSFDLAMPDPGDTLSSALLEIHQGNLLNDPYSRLGLLFVERIDMGAARDLADFGAPAGARSIGSSDPSVGTITIDVTALVQEALDLGRTRVDMRFRFGVFVDPGGVPQQTHFTSSWHTAAPISLPPILRLQWRRAP